MSDLRKILSEEEVAINAEQLAKYAKGELSAAEAHAVEMLLNNDDAFENDAVEGLTENKSNIDVALYNINKKIDDRHKAKNKAENKALKNQGMLNQIAVWLILGLIVVGYIVIKLMKK